MGEGVQGTDVLSESGEDVRDRHKPAGGPKVRWQLVESIVSLSMLQCANYVLPFLVTPYLIHVLKMDRFGLISFAQAFSQYFVILTDYGFNLTATRQIAINKDNRQFVADTFRRVMTVKAGLLLASAVLMSIVVAVVPRFRAEWSVYAVSFVTVVGSVLFPLWFFQGMEKMRYITILNVTAKATAAVAIFVLVRHRSDYVLAAAIQAGGFLIAGILAVVVVWRGFGINPFRRASIAEIGPTLKEGTSVFIANVSGNIYGQGALFITGVVAGNTAAGFYALAQKIGGAVVNLFQPIAQAVYPHLAQLFVSDIKGFVRFRRKLLLLLGAAAIVAGGVLFAASPFVTKLMAGKSYSLTAVLVMRIYALMMIATAFNVLLNPFILAMKKYEELRKMLTTLAALFLAASLPLTHFYGAVGMAYTMLGIEVLAFIISLRISRLPSWQSAHEATCT